MVMTEMGEIEKEEEGSGLGIAGIAGIASIDGEPTRSGVCPLSLVSVGSDKWSVLAFGVFGAYC